jgi:ADP-ribose pyrophosphatase YjhB (NUDIX family)
MQMHFDNNGRLIHESCGVIITNRAGKLLLFKRTKFPYLLTIPAGHLEIGEAPLTCAGRETEEEIGVRPENLIELFVGDIEGDSCLGGADIHHWYAYGCVVDDAIKVQLDGEGLSWGWYDKQDLSSKNTVQPVMYLIGKDEVTRRLDGLVVSYSSANSTKQLQL